MPRKLGYWLRPALQTTGCTRGDPPMLRLPFERPARARAFAALVLLAAASATLLLPPVAHAEVTLQEIVVTAQRRVERLQDVPLAITALSGTQLTDRGVRQAADIAPSVPNMLVNLPYGS